MLIKGVLFCRNISLNLSSNVKNEVLDEKLIKMNENLTNFEAKFHRKYSLSSGHLP